MIVSAAALLLWPVPVALAMTLAAAAQPGWRWRSALWAGGVAAWATILLWIVLRLAALPAIRGLVGWGPPTGVEAIDAPALVRAILWLRLGAAVVLALFLLCAVRLHPLRSQAWPSPLALPALTVVFVAGVIQATAGVMVPVMVAPLLDGVAVGPVVALGLAMHFVAPWAPDARPPTSEATAPSPVPAASLDPEVVLRQAGRLRTPEPDFQVPGSGGSAEGGGPARSVPAAPSATSEAAATGLADAMWRQSGGAGPPPAALTHLLAPAEGGGGALVGDLPAQTETAFITALCGLALVARAGRVLVVCADPEGACNRVLRILRELDIARPGVCVARIGALTDALARGEVPALICLGLGELSSSAIRALAAPQWLAECDLVLLQRVDRLLPIEATHLALTLRRLALAIATQHGRSSWVAVGDGAAGTQRFLEQATSRALKRLPLGATTRAGVRVFIRRLPGGSDGALKKEAAAFARTLAATHLPVHVEDALGALGSLGAELAGGREHLSHRPGYRGRCSVTLLEDHHLAGSFRARLHLAHPVQGGTHLGCWWVPESPLSRFLLEGGTLGVLEQRDELTSPRPVAGLRNPFLAAAHLEAALSEGRADEATLRHLFGDAPVDELLAARRDVRVEGTRASWDPRAHTIVRSRILTGPGAPWPDERRETVTQNVVAVRSQQDGALLRRVDRRVVQTRFYPHRVFLARGALYQVGEGTLAPTADQVAVTTAPVGAAVTQPLLRIELTHRSWLGELERHRTDQMSFARGIAAVAVEEAVAGILPRGESKATVHYAPVRSRYESVAAVVFFERVPSAVALWHVARLIDLILPSQLLAEPEDIEVLALPEGHGGIHRPALVFADRNVGGIGVAEALEKRTLHDLLRWTRGVLYSCPCMQGCPGCTPPEVLTKGPDKQGALKLLGG